MHLIAVTAIRSEAPVPPGRRLGQAASRVWSSAAPFIHPGAELPRKALSRFRDEGTASQGRVPRDEADDDDVADGTHMRPEHGGRNGVEFRRRLFEVPGKPFPAAPFDVRHQPLPVERLPVSLKVDLLLPEQGVKLLLGKECRDRLTVAPIGQGKRWPRRMVSM